ncbi:GFA family protein [Pontivivens ytuae]|uniref:GFA family protein n=1 Tax=Pontivivens ytuae TaxID=2789856 RepID=UPI001E4C08B1|nr:GFA family protein [Pontivivens ytuae]
MSTRRVGGGCHCGAVAYVAEIDLAAPTIRCNCSICLKSRGWIAPIPATAFRLIRGAEHLARYSFAGGDVVHRFCPTCGVKTHGEIAGPGGWIAVCVATLDLAEEDLARIPVSFADGRADMPERAPEVASYL